MKRIALMLVALQVSAAKPSQSETPTSREARTLAVREAIRAGLSFSARLRLTAGVHNEPGHSNAQLRTALASAEESILDCFLEATRELGPIGGRFKFRLEVAPDGRVSQVESGRDAESPPRPCLRASLGALVLPPATNANTTRATVRIDADESQVIVAIAAAYRDAAMAERKEQAGKFTVRWPVENTKVNSKFGRRPSPFGANYEFHAGVDLRAKMSQPVLAVLPGRVKYSGWRNMRGKEVVIDHGGGFETGYGHLSKILVNAGDTVAAGQVIGLAGTTGASTFPHLHFEVAIGSKKIDPLKVLGKTLTEEELAKLVPAKKRRRGKRGK